MNPIRSILVHLDTSAPCPARLRLADELAQRFDATARALFAATAAEVLMPFGDTPEYSMAAVRAEFEADRRQRARAAFDAARAQGRGRLQWAELPPSAGMPAFVQQALYADLLVLGQRLPRGDDMPDVPADFVESVLVASGRPAIVVPHIGLPETVGRNVLVAWKETREAARAVSAALPLLQAADAVHVLVGAERADAGASASSSIEDWLGHHGVKPKLHRFDAGAADAGDLLLSEAAARSADLLVMGCYGHARAREWMLGGASRTVLQTMTLPVLMAH